MNIRLFLLSLVFVPVLCWGQLSARLSSELQAKTLTASADELIPVIIALQDPVERDAVARRITTLKSVESQRKMAIRELSNARLGGLNTIASLLQVASRRNESSNTQKMVVGNLITSRVSPAVLKELQQNPLVKWVDVDHKATMDIPVENNEQIPLTRSSTAGISWNVDFVEAPRVWSEYGITGKGIVVALLDSGVDYNHPNLQGNMWQSAEYPHHGWDFVDNDNDPMDENRHGTHCAGTIAGNRTGEFFCGVAPEATIMVVRVLDKKTGGTLSNLLLGIDFAVRNNADVISGSLGFGVLPLHTRNMVREVFDDLVLFNIPAIIAAGNDGKNINGTHNESIDQMDNVPGSIPSPWIAPESKISGGTSSVITIGASDRSGIVAQFSSIGPAFWETAPYNDYPLALKAMTGLVKPDIVAPGTDIPSLKFKTTEYAIMNGTSMSTPCVAGITALMLQSNPRLSIAQIDRILQNTATKHTQFKNNVYGSGVVNAYAAVSASKLSTPTRLWVEINNDECTFSWEAPDKKSGLTGYQIYGDNDKLAQISANNLEYKIKKTKSYKSYHITALYGTTESLASNSICINNDLYAPFNLRPQQNLYTNNVDLSWQTPYENISVDWGVMESSLILFDEEIKYYRIRFDKDNFKEVAKSKLKICNAKIYTILEEGNEATIKLINGGKVLNTQNVVIGKNNIKPVIEIDLSSIKDQFDPSLETFVEVQTSVADAVLYTSSKFHAGVNYYSLDGKEWKEVDMQASMESGDFMIRLEFEAPLISKVGIMHKPLGYNIYQNGIKVNETPFMGSNYMIRNIPEGKHTFAVSSTVDGRESELTLEKSVDVKYKPVIDPTPRVTSIKQKGGDVHIYIENIKMNGSRVTVYQDGKEIVHVKNHQENTLIIKNVTAGVHKYQVEIYFNGKFATTQEEALLVVETMTPKNISATLRNDTTLLKWLPATSFIRHHGDVGPLIEFWLPSNFLKKHYIATRWSAEKLKPVAKQQLKGINVMLRTNMDSIHVYVYKNGKLCSDQPVASQMDYEHTVELKTPVTVNEGDSLFVTFLIHSRETSGFFDRTQPECPENNLISLDGVKWEPVSKYSTEQHPSALNWHVTLRFGEEATPVDLNTQLPLYFRVKRNGEFAGLLSGSTWEFSEKLPSYGSYSYTVESIFKGPQTRTSSEVTVNYSPTSVEKVESLSSIFVSGSEIIISNASGDGTLLVFNTEGKQMLTRSVNKGYNAIQTNLPAGVYVVKLSINQTEESVKVSIL